MIQLLVAASLCLQFLNLWLILRLVAITGRQLAWWFIGTAMVITAVQRAVTLYEIWSITVPTPDMLDNGVTMVISSAMAALGLYLIRPVFESLRRAEVLSRQSEEQYRALFEHSPLPIAICHQGNIQYANRAVLSIMGVGQLAEIADRPFTSFCDTADRRKVEESFDALREDQPPQPMIEITLYRADGSSIEVEAVIALFLYGGALAQYIVMWDVSNRKRKEEQLRARETELALVNRRQTMGEIAAELAHEVNQPLYAVCNFAEAGLLQLDSHDAARLPEVRHCLEQAHAQATRAAQIVKNLRNFLGNQAEQSAKYNLNQMVRDAFELVAIEARRRKILVEFQLSGDEPIVKVNRIQLEQVIVNSLINAFEALAEIPSERRIVRVSTDVVGGAAVLRVADHGPGISPENRARIFDPFFTTKPTGMGMGLSICRTIVLECGGTIEVLENDPSGAKVRVALPIAHD